MKVKWNAILYVIYCFICNSSRGIIIFKVSREKICHVHADALVVTLIV